MTPASVLSINHAPTLSLFLSPPSLPSLRFFHRCPTIPCISNEMWVCEIGDDTHAVEDKAQHIKVLANGDDTSERGASVGYVAEESLKGAAEVLGGMVEGDVEVGEGSLSMLSQPFERLLHHMSNANTPPTCVIPVC